jgi:2-aminoethylphosphonate-pyruvate transaminase
MDAIILAAGMGERIRFHHTLPKGFIKIGTNSLIEQSIKILRYYGIKKIVIVTGYQSEYYEKLKTSYSKIDTIYNADYATSGSLYSWYLTKSGIENDFLLLESDILYPEFVIGELLNHSYKDIILISDITGAADAVFIETKNNFLVKMDKNPKNLLHVAGEMMGIAKISYPTFRYFLQKIETNIVNYQQANYETDGLVYLAQHKPIFCQKMMDAVWCEIDNMEHLKMAAKLYNKIRSNSVIFGRVNL